MVLPIFQLEINDYTETEALISENLVCNVTGIGGGISLTSFGHGLLHLPKFQPLGKKLQVKNENVSSAVRVIPTKVARIRKLGKVC